MRPPTPDQLEQQTRDAINRGDWWAADQLGHRLDTTTRPAAPVALLPAALWYAAEGIPVFPLTPGAKHPLPGSHGLHDATTDPAQISAWWQRTPEANIGLATGHRMDVIDIDGPAGIHAWAELATLPDGLPPILGTVNTPRPGGNHLYVAATGQGNKAGIFPGIDYRGAGGYVVAPPSRTTAGARNVKHPGPYTWRRPLTLAPLAAVA